MMPLWLLSLFTIAGLLTVSLMIICTFPSTRFRLWLNRPARALIAARRFKVPYRYAFLIFSLADHKEWGTLSEEEQRKQSWFIRQHYPEQYQRLLERSRHTVEQ